MKRYLHLDSFQNTPKPKPHSGLLLIFLLFFNLSALLSSPAKAIGMAFLLSGIIFNLNIFNLYSQQPTQEWVARYERPSGSSGIANQMALDKVGNCYVLGNANIGLGVMVLIKYNSSGDTVWTRTFNEVGNEGVIADSIGNVYVTGYFGPSFGPYNILIAKFNPAGTEQWIRIYDSGSSDEPIDIDMDKFGNVYIGGFAGNQCLIIKYNPSGDTLWTRKYSETNYSFPVTDLILDNRNNMYICGVRAHTTNNSSAQFTIKYDSNAVFKWINNPLVTQMASPVRAGADNNGNVFVTGLSFSGKIMTVKYDSGGIENWQRIYDGPGSGTDCPTDMEIDHSNNIVITGYTIESGNSGNYVTIKYNSIGDSLWVNKYNGPGNQNDESYSLSLDESDNVYVTGRSRGNFNNFDYTTIKYNADGSQNWVERFPDKTGGSGIAYCIIVDKQNNVFISGLGNSLGVNGYITLKYSQPVGINLISTNISNEYKLEQNYPNPFNPVTNIKYEVKRQTSNW